MESLDEQKAHKHRIIFDPMGLEVVVKEVNKHIVALQQKNVNIIRKKHFMGEYLRQSQFCW